jgi:uncharacterized membrane protein
MAKRISLIVMTVFYLVAGINHFIKPESYYKLIPGYLPYPVAINIISGVFEIIFALLLIFPSTRKMAVYGIIALLIAFIPAHIVMIQNGFCLGSGYCLPAWATWFRLFPLQFILMWWAWSQKYKPVIS